MNDNQRMIQNALSLRKPQAESLDLLRQIVDKISLTKNFDLLQTLSLVHQVASSVKDFERAFPSICFSLAKLISRRKTSRGSYAGSELAARQILFFLRRDYSR